MASSRSAPVVTGFKPKNKLRRQSTYQSIKKAREAAKRDERFKRKREEAKNPELREERLAANVPATIDAKRTWDEGVGDEEDALGWAVDVARLAKKRKLEEEAANGDEEGVLAQLKRRDEAAEADTAEDEDEEMDEEADSMLDSDSEADDDESDSDARPSTSKRKPELPKRASSPTASTATNLELSPEFLKQKFPAIFAPPQNPKVLITTSINSSLHREADIFTTLIPNSTYIRRSAHAHSHKYSVREIAKFASARGYTSLMVLMQDMHQKKLGGLDIVTLPEGPHFHFSVTNWIEGKKLPGHGNPTGHVPELALNNFKTPLGILTAQLFTTLYPARPEFEGRTVVTLHNQRDYIFLRRHRYVFRERRSTEKPIVGADGRPVAGVEGLRAGLQELGPRCTLKLRRIDRGVQWKSGQEWEWKGRMDKQRTRFNM